MAMRAAAAARQRARHGAEDAIVVVEELDRHLRALGDLRRQVRRAAGMESEPDVAVQMAGALKRRLARVGA